MIFSDSEREHYRKELEAASKAGDVKRVKRLIGQIRLLGDIRGHGQNISSGIEEYIKHQSMVEKEKDRKDKPLTCEDKVWKDIFDFNTHTPEDILGDDDIVGFPFHVLFSYIKNMKPCEDLPIKGKYQKYKPITYLGGDDIVGFHSLLPYLSRSFRDVLRLGFKGGGWTW